MNGMLSQPRTNCSLIVRSLVYGRLPVAVYNIYNAWPASIKLKVITAIGEHVDTRKSPDPTGLITVLLEMYEGFDGLIPGQAALVEHLVSFSGGVCNTLLDFDSRRTGLFRNRISIHFVTIIAAFLYILETKKKEITFE